MGEMVRTKASVLKSEEGESYWFLDSLVTVKVSGHRPRIGSPSSTFPIRPRFHHPQASCGGRGHLRHCRVGDLLL